MKLQGGGRQAGGHVRVGTRRDYEGTRQVPVSSHTWTPDLSIHGELDNMKAEERAGRRRRRTTTSIIRGSREKEVSRG